MNLSPRRVFVWLLFASCLAAPGGSLQARSLDHGLIWAGDPEGAEEGESQKHELLFKIINSALLVGGLVFLLRKPMAEFFAQRSASIRKSLEEGRKALEASQAQLSAVEEKLRSLEEEIRAFKASAAREMEAERERLRQAAAEEAEKILALARAQIETATRGAKLDLQIFAAQQAVELAGQMIRDRLDEVGRRRLVSRFTEGLIDRQQSKVS